MIIIIGGSLSLSAGVYIKDAHSLTAGCFSDKASDRTARLPAGNFGKVKRTFSCIYSHILKSFNDRSSP